MHDGQASAHADRLQERLAEIAMRGATEALRQAGFPLTESDGQKLYEMFYGQLVISLRITGQ